MVDDFSDAKVMELADSFYRLHICKTFNPLPSFFATCNTRINKYF